LSTYRLPSPYERTPLQRRASGLALAVAVNLGLLLLLLTLGRFAPEAKKVSRALVVDLLPESHSAAASARTRTVQKPVAQPETRPAPPVKPPPIILPVKPTIAPPPAPPKQSWIEMSKDDMAAADVANLPKAAAGSGSGGDSEVVGTGPHGETLYAAEWARHPTDAELSGNLPANAPDGFGLIACKTAPGNRVEDCIELDQEPRGSHLASAVRQAAWQFRVRPPRKNGRPLIGSWVRIRIDYEHIGSSRAL
jgi:protein TonB